MSLTTTATTILFFGQINANKVYIIDTVRPGSSEKTLWSSCLPSPNRIPSNSKHTEYKNSRAANLPVVCKPHVI